MSAAGGAAVRAMDGASDGRGAVGTMAPARGRGRAAAAAWAGVTDGWVRSLRASGRSDATVRVYRQIGRWLTTWAVDRGLRPRDVTTQHLEAWMSGADWSRKTRQLVRTAVRGMFRWAVTAGLVETNAALELPSVLPSRPAPHPTPDDVYTAALAGAKPRERLMLRLAAEAGLRRAEVAQLHARDVVHDGGGHSLLINGKGARERLVPVAESLALEVLEAAGGGYVFASPHGGHLSVPYVGMVISALLGEHSMHSLRHRFATRAYSYSGDVLAVQQLLGHASPATTQLYVRIEDERKRRLIEGMSAA